ncbi:hypothetical protein ACPCHT_09100 [Nucisporomicrobium flavum]|uniref:hypothetical protein n=1 Tax=Nucisporomicrobium flavum TaxID=2785915 RepID=UPI003C2B542E
MTTIAERFTATPSATKMSLSGLAVGVAGLVVQWIADPAEFPGFPPGIGFIAVCAALVVAAGRWWAPIFSVLISFWIVLGGWAAGVLVPNLRSDNAGTVVGNAVMTAGLVFAAVTGIVAMIAGRRS